MGQPKLEVSEGKVYKKLGRFGLEWHTRGDRGGLWQDKDGHIHLHSLGLPNYRGILPSYRDSKFILPKSLMTVCTRENCLQWCLITVCPLFTPSPCRCHYAFDWFLQPVYRKLRALGAWPGPWERAHAQGDPLATLQSLTWFMHCFVYDQKKSFTEPRNLQSGFISSVTMYVQKLNTAWEKAALGIQPLIWVYSIWLLLLTAQEFTGW